MSYYIFLEDFTAKKGMLFDSPADNSTKHFKKGDIIEIYKISPNTKIITTDNFDITDASIKELSSTEYASITSHQNTSNNSNGHIIPVIIIILAISVIFIGIYKYFKVV